MNTDLTKDDLIAFQEDIKEMFLAGKIRHPVHLCDPNQIDHLLPIFGEIQPQDWLFTTYRGIFHWLLKGVPPEQLRQWIIDHGAMGFCDAKRRIVSSAIVGGCLPMAVGTALAMKRYQSPERVWCFVGDMAAQTGGFHESTKYATINRLPISFVVEDNDLSTNTPTKQTWGFGPITTINEFIGRALDKVTLYEYQRTVPHVGVGQWVSFS